MATETLMCSCGGYANQHILGSSDCLRVEVKHKPITISDDRFVIRGRVISGTTLREQRGYSEHAAGRWSAPKDGVSENSLNDA